MLAIQKRLSNSFYAILAMPATAMGFALCVQISALSWILSTKYNLKIEEIAERVGYNSKSSFNTSFKKIVGKTPSVFKKEAGL